MSDSTGTSLLVAAWVLNQASYCQFEPSLTWHVCNTFNMARKIYACTWQDKLQVFLFVMSRMISWDYHLMSLLVTMPPKAKENMMASISILETDRSDECSICYSPMVSGQRLRMHKTCRHAWHRDCIKTWHHVPHQRRGPKCPTCRAPVIVST